MNNLLFDTFAQNTKEQWEQQVNKDLKGKDSSEVLSWMNDENFKINSFNDGQDIEKIPLKLIQKAQIQALTKTYYNRENIRYQSEKDCNHLIISSLEAGADSVVVDFSGVPELKIEINKLLRNIKMSSTPFFFKVENEALKLVNALQIIAPYQWKGGLINDILGRYFKTGIYDTSEWIEMAEILRKVQNSPSFKTVTINGQIFHNSGANMVQELAYTFASMIETIDKLCEQKIPLLQIVQKIEFSLSVGTNYFGEIAKIRALRFLWHSILKDGYGMKESEIPNVSVHCSTSSFYNSSVTPHTNLLRATTEAMAAIVGGCDSLTIGAFDESYQEANEFSSRIARNIDIILKEESYFDKVIDPSAGSYFIENLTFQMAEESLNLLKEVENQGGIVEAFSKNYIQNNIKRNFENKQNALLNNQNTMVGVNKFRFDEKPFVQTEQTKPRMNQYDFDLLTDLRLSTVFEK